MDRNSSCLRMVQGMIAHDRRPRHPLQICNIVKLAASQNLLHCEEQVEITGGLIRVVKKMTMHINGLSVDRFLSQVAGHNVMMKQHGQQQGRSFLLHGFKKVSVQLTVGKKSNP